MTNYPPNPRALAMWGGCHVPKTSFETRSVPRTFLRTSLTVLYRAVSGSVRGLELRSGKPRN